MTEFDKEYLRLVREILTNGTLVENRTGVDTIKIPKFNFEFDLTKEFPILQSKQTFYKNAIIEMLWIWQMQSNDVRDLHERKVNIWDEWMVDSDGIYRIYEPDINNVLYDPDKEVVVMDPLSVGVDDPYSELKPKYDSDGKVMTAKSTKVGKTIKAAKYYGKENAYTIVNAYGAIVRRYKHTQNIIKGVKDYPTDRRIVKSLWQDEFIREAVLPSCVWATEWDVTGDKLSLLVHQRSCDVPLGLPFNVTQYATFLSMIAHVTGYEPSYVSYSIKDAHIYVNQIDKIREQLARWDRYQELNSCSRDYLAREEIALTNYLDFIKNQALIDNRKDYMDDDFKSKEMDLKIIDLILNPSRAELWLNPDVKDFFEFDNSRELKDIKIKKYKHLGRLDFPKTQ